MTTEINIPTEPRSFAVELPSSNLRQLDFSALDYDTARQSLIEYVRTYYPDDFNDFVASNGFVILMDIIAALTDKLSLRTDLMANEAFLPTAVTEEAVENHLQLIGQRIRRQTPATVEMEVTVDRPVFTDVLIPPGSLVSTIGPDGSELFYEVYKGPGDWTSNIVIPAGKRGVVAWGVQGQFVAEFNEVAFGGPNQRYDLFDDSILPDPIYVEVTYGGVTRNWRVIQEPIQIYGPQDEVVEIQFFTTIEGQPVARFIFGDDFNGKAPISGSEIVIRYRTGGGTVGRIAAGAIDQPRTIRLDGRSFSVNFRNISPSVGGTNRESVADAKRRAPSTYALHSVVVTANDYAHFANSFSHPVYGEIGKSAVILETSPNKNIVDLYVLAAGNDGLPISATVQLKEALVSSLSSLNVVTDEIRIKDGIIHAIDLEMIVVLDRNVDGRIVQNKVNDALTGFFALDNFDLGEPLYISNLIETIEQIGGVRYIDLKSPNKNIIASGRLADDDPNFIGVNEIITLGTSKVDFFYDNIAPGNAVL